MSSDKAVSLPNSTEQENAEIYTDENGNQLTELYRTVERFSISFTISLNEQNIEEIKKPLEYLTKLNVGPQKLIEDAQAIQSLIEINSLVRKDKDNIDSTIEVWKGVFLL